MSLRETEPSASTGAHVGIAYAASDKNLHQLLWRTSDATGAGMHLAQPWLEMLCEQVRDVITGFVLFKDAAGAYAVAASKPIEVADQHYLQRIAEQALGSRATVVFRPPRTVRPNARVCMIVAVPIIAADDCFGAVVIAMADASPVAETQARRQIESAAGWFHAAALAALQARTHATLSRAQMALRALAVVDEHARLEAAAMQLASYLETHLDCERASVGLQRKRDGIDVIALSHSGGFDRKSAESRRVQAAMEEAYDQDATVLFPSAEPAPRVVSLAHRALGCERTSLSAVLRTAAGKCGVITLERPVARPFTAQEIAIVELIASLVAPALAMRREQDRWVNGRALEKLVAFRNSLLGPRRPTLKLVTASLALLALFLACATGQYRVPAKAVVEGRVQRAASAPFDGFIASADIRAGAVVKKGDVLATLDDRDLRLERARWFGEREQRLKQYNDAFAKHDRATAGMVSAQVEQAESQLALAEENLARTQIVAPIDGLVVAGDLSQLIGSPVEKGKVLFEIAPLQSYRVILNVDERDIVQLQAGQHGTLAISGVVGRRVPFRVKNLTAITTADEGKNLFRVEAELLQSSPEIRPGMEGVGKVEIGERSLAWIWTHRLFDWLRLKLWILLP